MKYQVVLREPLEHFLYVDLVLLLRVAGHEDVVQVDKHVVHSLQNLVYEVLKN